MCPCTILTRAQPDACLCCRVLSHLWKLRLPLRLTEGAAPASQRPHGDVTRDQHVSLRRLGPFTHQA
eukprot:1285852-Prymnesium_polylepis.2